MKIIGVVGGVGPEASNKFCELLIKNRNAKKDQDHVPFLHFCNSQIPDRTDFILGKGVNPVPEMVKTCSVLEHAGADFLVIPCNTAHYFLPQVQEQVGIPIVDMTKVLVKNVMRANPFIKKIGILATTGSLRAGLYQKYFESVGVEVVFPNETDQENLVMGSIYGSSGIKAGKKTGPQRRLRHAAMKLVEEGAEALVLGCTEIPLVLKQSDFDVDLYDPMNIASKEILNYIENESAKEEVVTVRYVLEEVAVKVRAEIIKRDLANKAAFEYSDDSEYEQVQEVEVVGQ